MSCAMSIIQANFPQGLTSKRVQMLRPSAIWKNSHCQLYVTFQNSGRNIAQINSSRYIRGTHV
ncbi:hypothetical protein BpHYR1_032846 [Brachionus plicatilis]|uniref:Uncharacterized protein n=1 Tax=Brachionus plicatilis TaxID=10195 RepID=A0A3M7Q4D2_BRAPC|nr:hypothetical protein BpHYR1_032846 [Brachionus plicatilis]